MNSPAQTEHLRRRNVARVLGALRTDGPLTRTDLSRMTGLAKATVGSIVNDLEAAKLAAETGELTASGPGRPGRAVALTGDDVLGLGLEVNVDYVSAVAMDLSGNVRRSATVPIGEQSPHDVVLNVATEWANSVRVSGDRLAGLSVAVPGLVGTDRRTVRWAPNLDWREVDLGAQLDQVTGLDGTIVDNDANCAAIGESSHGAAVGADSALYVTGTVGIGAGWLVNGDLVRGSAGFAGEVGHMRFGDEIAQCGCGRTGCWEASIGLRAVTAPMGLASPVGTPSQTAERVAVLAAGDAQIRTHLAHIGTRLGRGLSALASIANPEVIVLGGYFVPLAQWLLPNAQQAIDESLVFADLHRPELRLSPLGLEAAALGAAEESLTAILAGSIA